MFGPDQVIIIPYPTDMELILFRIFDARVNVIVIKRSIWGPMRYNELEEFTKCAALIHRIVLKS